MCVLPPYITILKDDESPLWSRVAKRNYNSQIIYGTLAEKVCVRSQSFNISNRTWARPCNITDATQNPVNGWFDATNVVSMNQSLPGTCGVQYIASEEITGNFLLSDENPAMKEDEGFPTRISALAGNMNYYWAAQPSYCYALWLDN